MILWQQYWILTTKNMAMGVEGCQKLLNIAWRHLWITPKEKRFIKKAKKKLSQIVKIHKRVICRVCILWMLNLAFYIYMLIFLLFYRLIWGFDTLFANSFKARLHIRFPHAFSTLHCNFLLLALIEQNQGKL